MGRSVIRDGGLIGVACIGVVVAGLLLEDVFQNFLEPIRYRIYLWQSGIDFIYGFASLFLYILARSYRGRRSGLWLLGGALGLLLMFVTGITVVRTAKIKWDNYAGAPEALATYGNKIQANAHPGPILYFFHADWCAECDDFERFVIGSPCVQKYFFRFYPVRVDVTDFELWHETLERFIGTDGVPSIAFQERNGDLFPSHLVGEHISHRLLCGIVKGVATR